MNYQHHYGIPNTYMDMYECQNRLTAMYPDVYNRVYPTVQDLCGRYDVPTNPRMYPYVDPAMLQQMVDEAYHMDNCRPYVQQYRGIFRDLLTILFIRELLGRRRRYYNGGLYGGPFGSPYGGPYGGGPVAGIPFIGY